MPRIAARRIVLLLVTALLVACGGAQPAPKGVTPAPIGSASSTPLVATGPATPSPTEPREDDTKLPISGSDPQRGPRSALVTIVLFSDFQCPFCARLEPTLEQVRQTYGDDVRIVWKNEPLPFHQHAKLAAQVGAAVLALKGQDAFWQFHDMVFRRQANLGPDSVRAWAVAVGVDLTDPLVCLLHSTHSSFHLDRARLKSADGPTKS
jgi:protein-disulfide isomerase